MAAIVILLAVAGTAMVWLGITKESVRILVVATIVLLVCLVGTCWL